MKDNRVKLCIVNPFQHGGGAEYQIGFLVDTLAAMDMFDLFYLAHHTNPDGGPQHYRAIQIGKNGHVPRLGYLMDAVPLYQALSAIQPQVIYQRVAGGYTGICAHYARRRPVRLVWHVAHDSDVSSDNSFFGRNPLRRFLERRSIEYGIRHASHVVTQTHHQAQLLMANYARAADAVIPNFHPLPVEELDKSGPLTVLWVANLKPVKRPDAFVRLAAALQDLSHVRFVMIGAPAGSEDRAWGKDLMNSINATSNLTYLGRLSQTEVNWQLAHAHLFVNTSVQEGFPNTFIQAWMREVPVVSLSVNPDQMLDQETVGICAGSESALAQAVRSLAMDTLRLREFAVRARAYAIRRHSLQNAALLAELLATGRPVADNEPGTNILTAQEQQRY
ncbi:MAG: glycosyltransferase family 4 protein [Steroidobacteraceae bacterium]